MNKRLITIAIISVIIGAFIGKLSSSDPRVDFMKELMKKEEDCINRVKQKKKEHIAELSDIGERSLVNEAKELCAREIDASVRYGQALGGQGGK